MRSLYIRSVSPWPALLAGLILSARLPAADILRLPIGDPTRRDRDVPVVLDGITDTRTGELITPAELVRRLANTQLLLIGEEPTDAEFHAVQRRMIEALNTTGREVLIGLQMYPYTQQAYLDQWSRGALTESGFLELSGWYEHWTHPWGYYREIFDYARTRRLPMLAVNLPREAARSIRSKGFEALGADARKHLPPVIDTTSAEHRRLFGAVYAEDEALRADVSPEQHDALYRLQCARDAAIGWNSARGLESRAGPDGIVVVLLGTGHVAYGLGAERQLSGQFPGVIRSLIPVPVRDAQDRPVTAVRASYANYVWGIPRSAGPIYPMLGVTLADSVRDPTRVTQIDQRSPAALGGVQIGDILLSIDATAIASAAALQEQTTHYHWGDSALLELRRGTETRRVTVVFRRIPAQAQ